MPKIVSASSRSSAMRVTKNRAEISKSEIVEITADKVSKEQVGSKRYPCFFIVANASIQIRDMGYVCHCFHIIDNGIQA
jgi:hypothetical protein